MLNNGAVTCNNHCQLVASCFSLFHELHVNVGLSFSGSKSSQKREKEI